MRLSCPRKIFPAVIFGTYVGSSRHCLSAVLPSRSWRDRRSADVADFENEPGNGVRYCLLPIKGISLSKMGARNSIIEYPRTIIFERVSRTNSASTSSRLQTQAAIRTQLRPDSHPSLGISLPIHMKGAAMRLQFRAESLWKECSRCVILAESERVGTPKTDMPSLAHDEA